MELKDLIEQSAHTIKTTPSGANIIVLNTGAIITPEDSAMLMALHSRSNQGLFGHLKKLEKSGSGRMMDEFYVGYGHKSIGDCGSTYVFIEGISMLAAKAIQDFQLYNGQECSTRYIDFGIQPFIVPFGSDGGIAEKLRSFYVESLPKVVQHVSFYNPMAEEEEEAKYKKAVNARAFDILRGFLPAGAMTNVAWQVNLRQAADRLVYLRNHPLKEVRDVADALQGALSVAHTFSFGHKRYEETEGYVSSWMSEMNYYNPDRAMFAEGNVRLDHNGIDSELLRGYGSYLKNRPAKTELPKQIGLTGALRLSFLLDFGSFRDIQRQRAVLQLMPILCTKFGFEEWYMKQLPQELQERAGKLLEEFEATKEQLGISDEDAQYITPMGYRVPCVISGDLPAWVYLVEIRATKFVHPTLQEKAIQMADILEDKFGECGLILHVDRNDTGQFDADRGKHDIVQK